MAAAGRRDTARLRGMSASAQPMSWALGVQNAYPAFVASASQKLRARFVDADSGATYVVFRLRKSLPDSGCAARPLAELHARFVQQQSKWRVLSLGTEIC